MRLNRHFYPLDRLDGLFAIGLDNCLGERDEKLRNSLLEHLDIPLVKWLKPNSTLFQSLATDASVSEKHRIVTMGDLLRHPRPPLLYLRRANEIAKAADSRLMAKLHPDVVKALYLCTIAAALVKCGQRIAKMNDEQLRKALSWLAETSWIEESLRQFAAAAMELLGQ